jgi:hypothetical protein
MAALDSYLLVTLISGVLAYFWWARARGHWPFAEPRPQ